MNNLHEVISLAIIDAGEAGFYAKPAPEFKTHPVLNRRDRRATRAKQRRAPMRKGGEQ